MLNSKEVKNSPSLSVVINAFTGEVIDTNLLYFVNLNDFKNFISNKWSIALDSILILLSFGNKMNEKYFNDIIKNNKSDNEKIYIFDKRLFSITNNPDDKIPKQSKLTTNKTRDNTNDGSNVNNNIQKRIGELLVQLKRKERDYFDQLVKPMLSPLVDLNLNYFYNEDSNDSKHQRIVSIIATNLGWLSALEIDINYYQRLIEDNLSGIQNILESLKVSQQYLQIYCYDVETLYNSNVTYLNILNENKIRDSWEDFFDSKLTQLNNINSKPLSTYFNKQYLIETSKALKILDFNLNNDLKTHKVTVNNNLLLRKKVECNIVDIFSTYSTENLNFELEKTMLNKFSDILENVRSVSHELLENEEPNNSYTKEAIEKISELKNNYVQKLHTIALALYTQTTTLLDLKYKLQREVVRIMGQISYIQIEILNVKKHLLKDVTKRLEKYQTYELELAHVQDIPIIYGLFIIETFRRNDWFIKLNLSSSTSSKQLINMIKDEKIVRNQWQTKFQSNTKYLKNELLNIADLDNFYEMFNHNLDTIPVKSELSIKESEILKSKLRIFIEYYIERVKELKLDDDIVDSLNSYYNSVALTNVTVIDNEKDILDNQNIISHYEKRIKNLELLLHTASISNHENWPTGLLKSNFKYFKNDLRSMNSKTKLSSSKFSNSNFEIVDRLRIDDVEEELRRVKQKMDMTLRDNYSLSEKLTKITNDKVNIEVERDAYKETLSHLNNELSRLTTIEADMQNILSNKEQTFKDNMIKLVNENKSLLVSLSSEIEKKNKIRDEQKQTEQIIAKNNEQIQELRTLIDVQKDSSAVATKTLKTEYEDIISNLKQQLREKDTQINSKFVDNMKDGSNNGQIIKKGGTDDTTVLDTSIKIDNQKKQEIQVLDSRLIESVYNIVSSNIIVLENIGLLLSFDDDHNLEIKRVKGLKKNMNQSILDESTSINLTRFQTQSNVLQEIKSEFGHLITGCTEEDQINFIKKINEIYKEKLYESAVIKRFDDIETLAKKLTKDNKSKKKLIDRYMMEKISLNKFEVGDLALFLPMKENNATDENSTTSSWNSTFSSVDLLTPPPFDNIMQPQYNQVSNKLKEKNTIEARPWAAFTAFEETSRYFLQDSNNISRNKEWFIGKISHMERFVADTAINNPYRVPKGTVWYHVTATLESYQ
ncbi:hypothetical protein TPHA_0A03760 [Tetrapisispora phaffii CBS 4417]|uniref:Autophagy-related protein 11 n=1 Tax=Tetrapisispora phaffii (strain ATCC 24235 / CBS 4417 / NBRC 1672 / NRRL Y-8282 / UCD 70-5) TaxID=1071381 RepID=G8BNH4_TETPH|nr:hypothetical protein TPHA_0A03760 [Tetrapisispora phaffii CBS 4417]CCE61452.1 hypothetical protein TPHA_0A03760 [Tetrapisispora phaffii CBS 4417]